MRDLVDFKTLQANDLYSPITKLVENGVVERLSDGRLHFKETIPIGMFPWVNTNLDGLSPRRCNLWLTIYFFHYNIIPRGCRNCWKIFLRPKSLKELFEVKELQERLNIPAKCGTEHRDHTGNKGGYGAYWYAPLDGGLEGARELLKTIETHCPDHEVGLKRGCTEMELRYPRSNEWDKLADTFNKVEDQLNDLWIHENTPIDDVPQMRNKIMKDWIIFAVAHGDQSYLEYTGGAPMIQPLVSYVDPEGFKPADFTSSWETKGIDVV